MITRKRPGRKIPSYVRDETTGGVRVRPRGRLLTRQPATTDAATALQAVHVKLAVATELFEHHGDGGRVGVYRAVLDAVEYFVSQGIPRATLEPLSAVAAAIVDADRGTASRIFEPDRRAEGGKPPSSISQLTLEGYLAAVTDCCIRHCKAEGMRPYVGPACTLAAQLVSGSTWPFRPSATELREIRERVMTRDRHSPDRIAYNEMLDSEVARSAPLRWAKGLLSHDWAIMPPA